MPTSLTIGIFVLGAVLIVMAFAGGNFKLFGQEVRGQVRGLARLIAGLLGIAFVALSVLYAPITARLTNMVGGTAPTAAPTRPADASPPPDSDDAALTQDANQGPDVVTGRWSTELKGLTVTVTEVARVANEVNSQTLAFTVTVDNQTGEGVSLPLFGSFVVEDANGRSYEADPFASDWPDEFPAGSTLTGEIMLEGAVGAGPDQVTLHFQSIMGSLDFSMDDQISIEGVTVP